MFNDEIKFYSKLPIKKEITKFIYAATMLVKIRL